MIAWPRNASSSLSQIHLIDEKIDQFCITQGKIALPVGIFWIPITRSQSAKRNLLLRGAEGLVDFSLPAQGLETRHAGEFAVEQLCTF